MIAGHGGAGIPILIILHQIQDLTLSPILAQIQSPTLALILALSLNPRLSLVLRLHRRILRQALTGIRKSPILTGTLTGLKEL